MALFPLFVSLENKKVLVVGGGIVALRKIEKLLPFKPEIKVVSKEFHPETIKIIKDHSISYEKREFRFSDLEDVDIVIVAVDDIPLQKSIFDYTRDKNILVNCVDSPDYCDFIFPAYTKKGDVVIGITTSGKAPGLSAVLREYIESILPENLEEILDKLSQLRRKLPKGEKRQKKIIEFAKELLKKGR